MLACRRAIVGIAGTTLSAGERAVLAAMPLGSEARFAGFLAASRNGRGWLFHVTEVEPAGEPA